MPARSFSERCRKFNIEHRHNFKKNTTSPKLTPKTVLIQTKTDVAAQKLFPILPKKSLNGNDSRKKTHKMFVSERNKQHQRVTCKELCRILSETIK